MSFFSFFFVPKIAKNLDTMSLEIDALRSKLLDIDQELIGLLGRRMAISKDIGRLKRQLELPIHQPEWWKYTSAQRINLAKQWDIDVEAIAQLFEIIQELSIEKQKHA